MSKQFAVTADGDNYEVEAARFAVVHEEIRFFDKDENIIHQFRSWTAVRTRVPQGTHLEEYRKGYESRMSDVSPPQRRSWDKGWDAADAEMKAST